VLVRALVEHLPSSRALRYLGDPSAPLRGDRDEVIAAAAMGHAPSVLAKVGVLAAIVHPGRRRMPLHLFFTPNAMTSRVLRVLRRLSPGRAMIQTITASAGVERLVPLLAPLDAVVVLSEDARARLVRAGLRPAQVRVIYPAVPLPATITAAPGPARVMLYAGDLDHAVTRRLLRVIRCLARPEFSAWRLIIACRPKSAEDAAARGELQAGAREELACGRVELHGQVDDMDALMRRCTLQLFLADHLRRKVDIPLVVLEGLARGLGLLTLGLPPLLELFERARAQGLEIGRVALSLDDDDALAAALTELVSAPELARAFHRDAPRLVAREFSIRAMVDAHETLYREFSPL
jgi:hypothetical protein